MTDNDRTREPRQGNPESADETENADELADDEDDEFALSDQEEWERVRQKMLTPAELAIEDRTADLFRAAGALLNSVDARLLECEAEAEDHRKSAEAWRRRMEERKADQEHGIVDDDYDGERWRKHYDCAIETHKQSLSLLESYATNMRAPEVRARVYELLAAIELAAKEGDTTELAAACEGLKDRAKRRWAEECERHRAKAKTVYEPEPWWLRKWLEALPGLLSRIDSRAAHLTAEQVEAAWKSGRPEQLCARLAAACGAFDYRTASDAWSVMRKYVDPTRAN